MLERSGTGERRTDGSDPFPAFESILATVPVGVVLLAPEGEITWANARAEELLGLSRGEIGGRRYDDPDWEVWDEDGDPISPEDHPVTHVSETGETVQGFTHGITLPDGSERWLSSNVAPVLDESGAVEQIVVALEDVTTLKRLEQLVATFQPVVAALNRATTREDAEVAVRDLLADSRQYDAVWIAECTPGTTLLDPRVAGGPPGFPDDLVERLAEPDATGSPVRAAVETGEMQVVTGSDADAEFESWREEILAQGFHGSAVVPLTYGGRTHGLLGLHTARADAFGRRERTLLQTVGERFGQLIHALDAERLLHADTVVELTFRSTDAGSFLVRASEALGCTIDVMDTIPTSDGTLVHYASVRGVSLDALADLTEADDPGGRMRPIQRTDDQPGGDVELELRRQSLAQALVDAGARVTKGTVTDGQAEVVCEVSAGEDIETLVTRLTESFPETELVAKRESDRAADTVGQRPERVLAEVYQGEELTDRQRQVLRASVYAGYFDSPRRSTATEIAEALSLTQSTVSYHLRKAQQTLFERMLERQ